MPKKSNRIANEAKTNCTPRAHKMTRRQRASTILRKEEQSRQCDGESDDSLEVTGNRRRNGEHGKQRMLAYEHAGGVKDHKDAEIQKSAVRGFIAKKKNPRGYEADGQENRTDSERENRPAPFGNRDRARVC